ncbi:MAG TPA: hypothetical protein VMW53_12710 [archaeon]|nr:hypothetical protein [archaeon]
MATLPQLLNNRKAPATPHTTRPGGANQDLHPARVKARGAVEGLRYCKKNTLPPI